MKKQSMKVTKAIIRNKLTGITVAMLIFANATTAQTRAVAVREPLIGTATVKHIGNPQGSVVFQVQYDNITGDRFSLTIKDEDGAILYQDVYADKKFDKKFQLPQGEADKIKFIIKGIKTNHIQTFEVNTNTRIIEEVAIKRVS
jgi:hypothetical protein